MTISQNKFIALVHRAYPEIALKPMLTDEQQMLFWQVTRIIDKHPEIVDAPTVQHNLSRDKRRWLAELVERRKAAGDV